MRDEFQDSAKLQDAFRAYFRDSLLAARAFADVTQAEMAFRMEISTRSYVSLEGGHHSCEMRTFLSFLVHACPDPELFLKELLECLRGTVDVQ